MVEEETTTVVVWPKDIYEDAFGPAPHDKPAMTVCFGGQLIVCYVVSRECGQPLGAIKITTQKERLVLE